MKKLIIWDFDGVISDSEKFWVKAWIDTLEAEKGLKLNKEQSLKFLDGLADKTRKHLLESAFEGLVLDEAFMQKISDTEIYYGMNFLETMPGVEDIISDKRFDHCIATGATKEQHTWKMTQFKWIEKYMTKQDYFTVDMVSHGKPAPDIFLLAAKTKNYAKEDCIIIGDSLNDFAAARAAGIQSIAFVGAEGNDTPEYRQKCLDAGVITVCPTMQDLKQKLLSWARF